MPFPLPYSHWLPANMSLLQATYRVSIRRVTARTFATAVGQDAPAIERVTVFGAGAPEASPQIERHSLKASLNRPDGSWYSPGRCSARCKGELAPTQSIRLLLD